MRKRLTKATSNTIHTRRRAYQRFNLNLNQEARREILHNISHVTFIKKLSLTRTMHRIIYKGKSFRIVYDKIRKSIITVLP